jgi:flagellar hook protein FlgE
VNGVVGHQTYLDVIGNNVANVNTVGFRKSSPVFSDLLSDLMRGATGPQGNVGGVSPMQVGLGSLVTAIDVSQAAGTLSLTDSPTDIAISGSGFFVVQNEQGQFYTRAGNFVADGEGYLVQSGTGNYLMGTRIGDGSVPGTPGGLER